MGEKQYKYHVITFGCQMNKNDSERIESIFLRLGMISSDILEEADVILLNSCSVRQAAEDRIYSMVHNFARLKEQNPSLIIAVTGCMPGRDKNDVMKKKMPLVDLFFPTKDMLHLPKWLIQLNPDLARMEDMEKHYLAVRPSVKNTTQAFVTIQTGCNHFCSYCVVPFARGLEVNRPLKEILEEVQDLALHGCLEITLLGQIVNHYIAPDRENFSLENPYKESDFAKLLWELNQIEGLKRIHYTAPHPIFMTEEVIDALTLPKQVNFLHLPVQSGSDEVLRRMNRRHTRDFFIDLVRRIREKKPDICIGTDIIVGFCGETVEQFEETFDLYKQCDFDISYTAQYSTRTGTLAVKAFTDDLPREEKKRRWKILQDLQEETVLRKNQEYIGKRVSVLVEECANAWCSGNTLEMKRARFKGDESFIGRIVEIEIFKAEEWVLYGIIKG